VLNASARAGSVTRIRHASSLSPSILLIISSVLFEAAGAETFISKFFIYKAIGK